MLVLPSEIFCGLLPKGGGGIKIGQEIKSSNLLDGNVPLLQVFSPFPFKVIKDKKKRPARHGDVTSCRC